MFICMYVCMHVCTKSFLKTTTNSLCVCTHLANKADSDSDSDITILSFVICLLRNTNENGANQIQVRASQ